MRYARVIVALCGVLALASALPALARGSQLIDRNASAVRLQVSKQGKALLSYRAGGRQKDVLVWGAVDARLPSPNVPQVELKVDHSGGGKTLHRSAAGTFVDTCKPYRGPYLFWLVTACTAADGSFWAVQSWQRALPDLGFTPWLPAQSASELRISHFTGPIAAFQVWTDWVYGGRYHHLFGKLSYEGAPVHGFKTTKTGEPLDAYGRNLYLDTLSSVYGAGWRRENSFVAQKPSGTFCYGFYPFKPSQGYPSPPGTLQDQPRGPGNGQRYRITVTGPGVSPDVIWEGNGLPTYDPKNPDLVALEQQQNAIQDGLMGSNRLCRAH